MKEKDMKFFAVARELSKCSDFDRIKIGAVILKKKEVLGCGFNNKKTHPMQKKLNGFRVVKRKRQSAALHAEMAAILHVANKHKLHGATIYVYRENCHGEIAMSRPCEACMAKIREVGIKKICYTTPDGFAMEEIVY